MEPAAGIADLAPSSVQKRAIAWLGFWYDRRYSGSAAPATVFTLTLQAGYVYFPKLDATFDAKPASPHHFPDVFKR